MGCKWIDVCPLRSLERQGSIDLTWRERYCDTERNWRECERYRMEEKGLSHAHNMMPDGSVIEI
jgi:hypothetical protein